MSAPVTASGLPARGPKAILRAAWRFLPLLQHISMHGIQRTRDNDARTVALSRASETMDRVDLWHARLALKRLRKDQREAIAKAVED